MRQILNKDQAKVEQAKALLEKDDSAANWKKVAAKYSTDRRPRTRRPAPGVVRARAIRRSTAQIFSAAQGQLVGPFKGQAGYYLIEVEKITPASTTPLSKASAQIKQQLAQGRPAGDRARASRQDFLDKWTSRTFCADGYVIDRCANFTAHARRVDPGRSSR